MLFCPVQSLERGKKISISQSGNVHQVLSEIVYSDDNDLLKIRRNLETLSKYLLILDLENPSSRLRDLIEFILLQKTDGKWTKALPIYNDLPKYSEDEQIAFQIINKYQSPIYISILDLGLTKKISLLYPVNSASDRIGSNVAATENNPDMGILQVGIKPNESITLFIPETAFLSEISGLNKKGGIEIFKLIATTEQTDFNWIEQDGLIARQNFNSSFEELLYKYMSESPTREARTEVNKPKDWFTIERGFYLCKK